MKYTETQIIGDAGEHLLAAKIIKLFKFPCRLINIDIGIDAEIEIIDNNYKSTGRFIKSQVKTTNSNDLYLYLDEEHILYWNSIKIPVVVFLVHLQEEKIYWHCVKNIGDYTKLKSGYKIEFNESNILIESNKAAFIEISFYHLEQRLISIYREAYNSIQEDLQMFAQGDYDLPSFEDCVYHSIKIIHDFKKAEKIIRKYQHLERVKNNFATELDIIEEYLRRVETEKQSVLEDYGSDYYDHLKPENWDWE